MGTASRGHGELSDAEARGRAKFLKNGEKWPFSRLLEGLWGRRQRPARAFARKHVGLTCRQAGQSGSTFSSAGSANVFAGPGAGT
jgi:hypothetical protein